MNDGMPAEVQVLASRLIFATGFNTAPLKPLPFTSGSAVNSLAPNDVLTTQWSYVTSTLFLPAETHSEFNNANG